MGSIASAAPQHPPIILYHYPYSPYALRVIWYLQLRGIPYYECIQPPILPRPDLTRLGITYRRIPILSIGRDVYLDSRLIISKLEQLAHPSPPLSASASRSPSTTTPESLALESLLRTAAIDGGLFFSAAKLIPTNLPLTRDPSFQKDRADFFGDRAKREEDMAPLRPEALNDIRAQFQLLETSLLADGRDWILNDGSGGPSLADIEAVWLPHWLAVGLPGDPLPGDQFSKGRFPRVYGWIERFQGAVKDAMERNERGGVRVRKVSGEEAEGIIRGAELNEPAEGWVVDGGEPVVKFHGLETGAAVEVWPTDTGTGHKEVGGLVGLNGEEVVLEKEGGGGGDGGGNNTVRVHAPRHGFHLRGFKSGSPNL